MWPAVPTTRFLRGILDAYRNVTPALQPALPRLRGGATSACSIWIRLLQLRRDVAVLSHRGLQIACVHDGLAAEMIVGDDVSVFVLRHRTDALDPWLELVFRVEIVVSLPRLCMCEPLLVVAAVQAHVRDRS